MKLIIYFLVLSLTCELCFASSADEALLSGPQTIITKSEFSDRFLFTCDISGINMDSFIFNSKSQTLVALTAFNKENIEEPNFKLKNVTDEYLLLERTYEGEKHRKSGNIKENIYILRYASKIGNTYAVKAKYKLYVNNEKLSGNDGKCDVTSRLF